MGKEWCNLQTKRVARSLFDAPARSPFSHILLSTSPSFQTCNFRSQSPPPSPVSPSPPFGGRRYLWSSVTDGRLIQATARRRALRTCGASRRHQQRAGQHSGAPRAARWRRPRRAYQESARAARPSSEPDAPPADSVQTDPKVASVKHRHFRRTVTTVASFGGGQMGGRITSQNRQPVQWINYREGFGHHFADAEIG